MDYPKLGSREAEILRLLIANGEMYGLELVNNSELLKRGTVYVFLSKMADKGYVESRLEEPAPADRPPRRWYKATGLGQRAYSAMIHASRAFAGDVAWA